MGRVLPWLGEAVVPHFVSDIELMVRGLFLVVGFTFTFMHLADAFIQSDFSAVHSGYTFFLSVHVFPGNRTHNLCAANAML